MPGKKKTTPSPTKTAGPGPDDKTRDAFRQALQAKNAKAAQRSGEDHLNGAGMTLHPNDKQQRTHRRKSG